MNRNQSNNTYPQQNHSNYPNQQQVQGQQPYYNQHQAQGQQPYYNQQPSQPPLPQQQPQKVYERVPTNLTEAEILAQQIERMESVVKQAKANLKVFLNANKGIQINGNTHSWSMGDSVVWEFEPEKLEQLAKIFAIEGYNPYELLTLTANAKKIDWIEGILPQYGKSKVTSRIKSAKRQGR